MLTCSTRPGNPSSATTMLLPPPSTNSGRLRVRAHSTPTARAPALVISAKYFAAPPIPGVVRGARGVFVFSDCSNSCWAVSDIDQFMCLALLDAFCRPGCRSLKRKCSLPNPQPNKLAPRHRHHRALETVQKLLNTTHGTDCAKSP